MIKKPKKVYKTKHHGHRKPYGHTKHHHRPYGHSKHYGHKSHGHGYGKPDHYGHKYQDDPYAADYAYGYDQGGYGYEHGGYGKELSHGYYPKHKYPQYGTSPEYRHVDPYQHAKDPYHHKNKESQPILLLSIFVLRIKGKVNCELNKMFTSVVGCFRVRFEHILRKLFV